MRLSHLAILCSLLIGSAASAQSEKEAVPELSTTAEANLHFAERHKRIWQENAQALAEIDSAYGDAVKVLGKENSSRMHAILADNGTAHKANAEKDLSGDERAAESRRIQAETQQARDELAEWFATSRRKLDENHRADRQAQVAATNERIARANEQRDATIARFASRPVSLGGVIVPDDVEGPSEGAPSGGQKSGASGRDLYFEHCDLCHGSEPGLRTSRYDLYEAVVVDDAAYFLNRVRNGPGPMPDIDEIQALTDTQIFSVRDFIREQGDINTGVVEAELPGKTPDPQPGASADSVDTGMNAPAPSGLPPITPGSPLPSGEPAESDAVRRAQTQTFGEAELTCNVHGDVDVSWIAPFSWNVGWIPPGATMNETGVPWGESWMLRLRARLEDPAETGGSREPAPGWCTYVQGSLGSVAGKSREIVIFAHTVARPFQQFRFSGGSVDVMKSNSSPADRGGRFAINVVRAVHGLIMPAGNRATGGNGEVHARVKRIDDRWSPDGEPAFLVVY